MATPYDTDLDRNAANFQPLTPLSFLARAAEVYPDQTAIIHGARRGPIGSSMRAPGNLRPRCRSAASSAATPSRWCCPTCRRCWKRITVSPWPAPCSIRSIRGSMPPSSRFTLDHGEAKVLIADREFSKVVKDALARCEAKPLVIDYDDPEYTGAGERLGKLEYEDFLREGDADFAWLMPQDEWDAIALNYTSGTTGDPKGVVYHHRGAYLLALANVITCAHGQASGLSVDAADVPLQRLVLSLDAVGRRRHACLPARGARRADLRRHRHPQGHASVRRADRDVDAARPRRSTRRSRCRMASNSSPPRRRRRKRCWRR